MEADKICTLIIEVLKNNFGQEASADTELFSLDLDSIAVIELNLELEERLNCILEIEDFYSYNLAQKTTVWELAQKLQPQIP